MSEIEDIREGVPARDENEHTEGICTPGFAIKDQNGDIFAISTPVPSTRYGRVRDSLSQAIKECRSEFAI